MLAFATNSTPPPRSDATRGDASVTLTFNLSQRFTADVILKFHSRLLPQAAPRPPRHQLSPAQLGLNKSKTISIFVVPPSLVPLSFLPPSLPPKPTPPAICPNLERLSRQWRLDRRRRRRHRRSTIQIWLNGPRASQGECDARAENSRLPLSKLTAFVAET